MRKGVPDMIWAWLLGALAVMAILLTAIAFACLHMVFGTRCDGDPSLRYFTHEDFDGMRAQPVSFPSDRGQLLRGAVYTCGRDETPVGLVVFAHGMGGGHLSYMTEIHTFAAAGFAVLAYDNTGTCASDGKKLVGFYQAVRDLRCALAFVRGRQDLSRLPVVLAGHSWGGYAVCQSLAYAGDAVSGVVALSAPESVSRTICDMMSGALGVKMGWMRPFFSVVLLLSDGLGAVRRTSAVLKKSTVPVLLLHGDADKSVLYANSPLAQKAVRGKGNITGIVCEGRGHNVYQTAESERYLNERFAEISAAKKKYRGKIPEQEKKRLYDIDYALITEEDTDIMKTVVDFMKACVGRGPV